MSIFQRLRQWLAARFMIPEEGKARRYALLRNNMIVLMLIVTLLPLLFMAGINYHLYQRTLKNESNDQFRILVTKTKHSFELFLRERQSAVSFIVSAYSFEQLADSVTLNRIFNVVRREFGGFVDIGLIDSSGKQVNYVGPYDLMGKDYSEQSWFREVSVRGSYISDVFLGYRKFPHLVIAVEHRMPSGERWVLRATIDTAKFDELLSVMGLDPTSDAFLINRQGVLQTDSKLFGSTLKSMPLPLPPVSYQGNVIEVQGPEDEVFFMGYAYFVHPEFILVVIKPTSDVFKAWYSLRSDLLLIFLFAIGVILMAVVKLSAVLVRRIQQSDEKREAMMHEVEHTQKLSSIGRLAAGVAHEINNPLAIINEKAGLMKDLLARQQPFPGKDKLNSLAEAVLKSTGRCRTITQRLLGFARRMDVSYELLDLNEVVKEVVSFLEKEAMYRNIEVILDLADDLPRIESDRSQLQQVFLNILNNALAAVKEGDEVKISTTQNEHWVQVAIIDTGVGMSKQTLARVFDPFFTTKGGQGTGLGLSITYGIVKKLGGEIDVQSQEGAGSTFTVHLPKQSAASKEEIIQ